MNQYRIGRRSALQLLGITTGMAFVPGSFRVPLTATHTGKFLYCLNTATIRGQKLGLVKELEIVSKAGYDGVEIWIDTLDAYLHGGTISELKRRIGDLGITVENAIGFEQWIIDDNALRKKAIEQLKKQMDWLAAIGCTRIAAPPTGATETPGLDLKKAAGRYRDILELGDASGVLPQLELWGFSANLSRLSEVLYVAVESGHPKAKILLDNYHLHKGGSSLSSLHLVDASATDIFHMNDYTNIPVETITDGDRVLPGDGISPLKTVLKTLSSPTRPIILSVEIFNKKYYSQDALEVARLALKKMKMITEGL